MDYREKETLVLVQKLLEVLEGEDPELKMTALRTAATLVESTVGAKTMTAIVYKALKS